MIGKHFKAFKSKWNKTQKDEHNFRHNALFSGLGVTLKSIMLEFSSIIYLTLFVFPNDG